MTSADVMIPSAAQLTPLQILDELSRQFNSNTSDRDGSIDVGMQVDPTGEHPEIEEEYLALFKHADQYISTLAKRHNAIHVPVNQFPAEVLIHVFKALQYDAPRCQHMNHFVLADTRNHSPVRDWLIPLTAVCHRWRRLALSEPSLWQDVPLHMIRGELGQFGQLLFHRCASLLIRVWCPRASDQGKGDGDEWKQYIRAIRNDPGCLEELHLPSPVETYPGMRGLLSISLPTLRCLSIALQGPDQFNAPFPHLVAPKLRRLTLTSTVLHVPDSFAPRLTHLCIVMERSSATPQDWLGVVQRMPQLQELVICCPHAEPWSCQDATYQQTQPIVLENLRRALIHIGSGEETPDLPSLLFIRKLSFWATARIAWFVSPPSSRTLQTPTNSITSTVAATFPRLDHIQFLVCGPSHGSTADPIFLCRMVKNFLLVPCTEQGRHYFFRSLSNIRILAFADLMMPQFLLCNEYDFMVSPTVEECHISAEHFINIGLLRKFERQDNPLLPNLKKFFIWKYDRHYDSDGNDNEKPFAVLDTDTSNPIVTVGTEAGSFRDALKEVGQVIRRKFDGTTYTVTFRRMARKTSLNIFTLEGMVKYVQSL